MTVSERGGADFIRDITFSWASTDLIEQCQEGVENSDKIDPDIEIAKR